VIIPAFNEEKLIERTLSTVRHALGAFLARGWEEEVIVCDNNSTDGTAELSRRSGARVVFEPVNQIGRARNTGAAVAKGDWLVFVDADSRPTRALFEEVAGEIERGRCIAGGVTVRLDRAPLIASLTAKGWNLLSRVGKLMAGSFIFCEASAFREIGGFNLDLYIAEELELSRRLKQLAAKRGKRVVILHRHPLETSARKMELYGLRDHAKFIGRVVLGRRRTWTDPERCHLWYDGRR